MKGGELARRWEGFQPRPQQLRMFREALRAIGQNDITVIEAGTGTGKTLAYLLPAVISRKKIVISTGLKNLQDQLDGKEIKFVKEYFDTSFTSTVLKGRESYVCLRAFDTVMRRAKSAGSDPAKKASFDELARWRMSTQLGEIGEIPSRILKNPPFNLLASTHENCLNQKCPQNSQCFLQRARARAVSADIVLVNHYLLMSDLGIKGSTDEDGKTAGGLLPDWDACIIDEAHLLEQVAIKSFSQKLSLQDLQSVCYELSQLLDGLLNLAVQAGNGPSSPRVTSIMSLKVTAENQQEVAARLSNVFQKAPGSEEQSFGELIWPEREKPERREVKQTLARLHSELKDLERGASALFGADDAEFMPISKRLKAASETARFISARNDPAYVYTVTASEGGVELAAMPIDVSGYLRDKLFNFTKAVVLTSATMSSRKSLSYFNAQLGIDPGVKGLLLDSPFDFWSRTVLYVPKQMPPMDRQTNNEKFREALVEELKKLLKITRGRALVLFTAYSQLNAIHERFSRMRLPFTLLKQGEDDRTTLLETFRRDESSVLMGTSSFWQGVDVPGQSLCAVIIDKLPFPVPSDPVHQARERMLRQSNKDGFNELSVPAMEIKLKQGLGRLIRSSGDWGLMAILDSRIRNRYGPAVLQSISHGPITNDIEQVKQFFQKMEPHRTWTRPQTPGTAPPPGPVRPRTPETDVTRPRAPDPLKP
jgi:ATP-dependent DNA helicase DinG